MRTSSFCFNPGLESDDMLMDTSVIFLQAFFVTNGWGAIVGWQLSLFRPDRVIALASLSNYYSPRNPKGSSVQLLRTAYGEEHYICKFQVHLLLFACILF